jgi:hypothetical protein
METTPRKIDWLAIDLANQAQRKAQASRALSLQERVRLALEKGDKLLAEARRAAKRGNWVMNIGDLMVQGIDLESAQSRLQSALQDIERLKVWLAEEFDKEVFTGLDIITEGSRLRRLIGVQARINGMGIDVFAALQNVKSALEYQQAALPTPEGMEAW